MKMFSAIRSMAVAAMTVSAIAATAAPKAKVFVNAYAKPNYAVVSVIPNEDDEISSMEVTDETGNIVYVAKRFTNVKSAQYLLNIAKLSDGVYNVNFTFNKGAKVSKVFVVEDSKVVK